MRLWNTSESGAATRALPLLPLPVLKENDTDGHMAVLMVTGYAQGPLCQMITEYGVNSHAHDALPTTGEMRHTRGFKVTTLKHR